MQNWPEVWQRCPLLHLPLEEEKLVGENQVRSHITTHVTVKKVFTNDFTIHFAWLHTSFCVEYGKYLQRIGDCYKLLLTGEP